VLVIQGNADLGPRISESEVQNALDFCASLFNPFNQGVANDLRKHLEGLDDDQFSSHGVEKSALMDVTAPLLPAKEVQNIARDPSFLPALENGSVEEAETEVQRILERINARRLIHREHSGLHSLEEETLGAGPGYSIRLECGRLGLMQGKAVNDA
jgi:flavine halogenase